MSKIISSAGNLLMENKIMKLLSVVALKKTKFSSKSEATFETKPYKLHRLKTGPSTTATLTAKEALSVYKNLTVARRLSNACGSLYREKKIRGFCHLYTGQEAVAAGMVSVMRKTDMVITSYRCHAWARLMGISTHGILAELMGRATGCSRSKGGSMHLYGPNFLGGNGIVGAQVPLGTGMALAQKYKELGGVTFALYGDGAANQGQIFEAFNIAKLLNLPCIYVCENNLYAMGTSTSRSSANVEYYTRGDYLPGIWADGMDVLAVREATKFAIEHCTNGLGPLVLEMETYRYHGHSMSDPGTTYRTRDEVKYVRKSRDPIRLIKDKIINSGLATADELKEIETMVKNEVNEAVKQAAADPEIDPEELTMHICSKNLHTQIRGVNPEALLQHKVAGRN
ncbi:pyruvate dehydrogenase E1 component subunit alpha, mitochondrial-like [Hyposmocoma kahamanoa]|uniref:pyruvate dehydrogenase E1 component subunit alpha, mitochondrial-like n=1 Tax=Hyposmocoma kahamanoa TaxID=1477025 RepID=UPI000E6D5C54|nr:pyruvate dehydrogenase E1 component subunit alpha, mitochondrial-like [Hyposmocoma kahamanoa]